ncbi:MAG: hypothetical protein Kow0088_06500 [Anaerolineales bacterium]
MGILIVAISVLSAGIYVGYSAFYYRVGFPLDDAWIHQTYARNFASGYGWSFEAGEPSGGATAPLWTVLLSAGYRLNLNPYLWAFMLGISFLIGVGFLAVYSFQQLHASLGWVGLFFLLEWHFIWASVSGMETMFAVFLIIGIYFLLKRRGFGWGIACFLSASIWIRPDLLSLFLPVSVSVFLDFRKRVKRKLIFLSPLSIVVLSFLAYLIFNQSISGDWLPTTFYAKQAEYAELRALPYGLRFWQQVSMPLIGGGLFLIVGFVYRSFELLKRKDWLGVAWIIWYLLMVGLYAERLPVTYQHGRYMIPPMVVYFLVGLEGSIAFGQRWMRKQHWSWILIRAWILSWVLVTVSFWWLGGRAYAKDVQLIETQMVDVAKWVENNLPQDSRIAVHDIGAIGYFTQFDLVDLAGLINPEVIPFIRNEKKLASYLDEKQVDYLICFPDWYPNLTKDLSAVFVADELVVREYSQSPMSVYRWKLNNFISLWME